MKNVKGLIVLPLIFALSCGNKKTEGTAKEKPGTESTANLIENSQDESKENELLTGKVGRMYADYEHPNLQDMGGKIGVVVFKYENRTSDDEDIPIYNEDGTVWARLTLFDENYNNYQGGEDFIVRAAKIDYDLLCITCVSETDSTYTIISNEKTRQNKILPKRDIFTLELWEEHIKHTFPYFETQYAKLYDTPNGTEEIEYDREEPVIDVLNVEGEWINIEIGDKTRGWIKWKDRDTLLAQLYYLL